MQTNREIGIINSKFMGGCPWWLGAAAVAAVSGGGEDTPQLPVGFDARLDGHVDVGRRAGLDEARYPLDGQVLWFRLRAHQQSAPQRWFIELMDSGIDRAVLYQRSGDGAWHRQEAGDAVPVPHWPVPGHHQDRGAGGLLVARRARARGLLGAHPPHQRHAAGRVARSGAVPSRRLLRPAGHGADDGAGAVHRLARPVDDRLRRLRGLGRHHAAGPAGHRRAVRVAVLGRVETPVHLRRAVAVGGGRPAVHPHADRAGAQLGLAGPRGAGRGRAHHHAGAARTSPCRWAPPTG